MPQVHFFLVLLFITLATSCIAEETSTLTREDIPQPMNNANADVMYVKAIQSPDGSWTFHVTVYHPDTGWEDYANGWDIVTPDGEVIKTDPNSQFTRLLVHPHVGEQPFTRSQAGVVIPDGIDKVVVRAHDLVDGFGGEEVTVELKSSSGAKFEVHSN